QGTNYPGTGNIDADPLFTDVAQRDYRLAMGSPALGSGFGGGNMGMTLPVGGLPPVPMKLAANAAGFGTIQVWWLEDADNETGFVLERSTNAAVWQALASLGPNSPNYTDNATTTNQLYFYRVRADNASGSSPFSN